jgi:hypothetical protein
MGAKVYLTHRSRANEILRIKAGNKPHQQLNLF